MPRSSRFSFTLPESTRNDHDRDCDAADRCVCCGAPGQYPVCLPCEENGDRMFAEDMQAGVFHDPEPLSTWTERGGHAQHGEVRRG